MGTICHSCGRRNQESRKICQFCGSELFPSRVESNVISSDNTRNASIAYSYDELIPIEVDHTHRDTLDKYDYLTAAGTGVVAGLIDVFLVGSPENSKLVRWSNEQVDNCVKSFAKLTGWESDNNVNSAISHLERKFSVNYDQRHTGDVGGIFKMSAKNHHMKSLAHSPDIIGLFFSILDQLKGTFHFVANGKLITVSSYTQELIGGNFISKIFCGFVNWFGHLMSDIAGSSDAKGRGTGIVAPFYELLGFCKFGNSDYGDLATIATKAFEQGYDARFALTTSIPVVLISDLLTRFIWGFRNYFQYKRPIKECIPTKEHSDLRIMLLVSNACLCIIDVADAGIRSKFTDPVTFLVHLNFAAWIKLAVQGVKEIANRCRHKEEYKYNDYTSNDFNIDDEDREIFLNSSWRQFIGASSVESHISSFRFYHNAKWERKANRHLAYAIVLATSEEIDTEKMINTYFSNNGSAEFLSNAFKVGWYCSPNYYMAKKYRTGNYTYEFVEIV